MVNSEELRYSWYRKNSFAPRNGGLSPFTIRIERYFRFNASETDNIILFNCSFAPPCNVRSNPLSYSPCLFLLIELQVISDLIIFILIQRHYDRLVTADLTGWGRVKGEGGAV